VGPFAKKLGFGKVYGSIYGTDMAERFTGKVEYEDMIQDKAAIFAHVLKKFNGDQKHSIAVGDTESDIPMMRLAAEAVAFNPNQRLYRYAKKRGWKIIVERKDVIYTVNR
jgi:phosphoserine phosphatase